MPADQLISLAQICLKTGRYARGDSLIPSIQKQKARLVLLSTGCGANRAKKIEDKCAFYHVPIIRIDPERFNRISPSVSGALAVLDDSIASAMIEKNQLAVKMEKDGD